jgi:hypothetical protein
MVLWKNTHSTKMGGGLKKLENSFNIVLFLVRIHTTSLAIFACVCVSLEYRK